MLADFQFIFICIKAVIQCNYFLLSLMFFILGIESTILKWGPEASLGCKRGPLFCRLYSSLGYYKILVILPCAVHYILVAYLYLILFVNPDVFIPNLLLLVTSHNSLTTLSKTALLR